MRPLQITVFILGMIVISTQTFRHVYMKWIAPTGSVLDEYRDPVEEDIAMSKDLDELVALFDAAQQQVQEHERTAETNAFPRRDVEPYVSEQRTRSAIERWEAQSRRLFELYFYWCAGLASISCGLLAYRRVNRWLGMVGIVTGFTEMAWWTSPLVRTRGPQSQFEHLLDMKLVLSVVTLVLLVSLWLLYEKRRHALRTLTDSVH